MPRGEGFGITLAIGLVNPEGTVMAADSRQSYRHAAVRVGSDSAIKVFELVAVHRIRYMSQDLELNGKGKLSLRVPMVDEDSGDPSVGVELHDLELEPAHVAP
jgi:hypothetical protein